MKKRSVIELIWDPCLAVNDNMLAFVNTSFESRIWLHRFKVSRLSSEKLARVEIEFYRALVSAQETDFFRDYKPISKFYISTYSGDLQARLEIFAGKSGANQCEEGPLQNTVYFEIPLATGKNFTTTAIKAATNAAEYISNGNNLWVRQLKIVETKTEVFEKNFGWVPFEEYLLRENGYK